jgi:hypothetical protein
LGEEQTMVDKSLAGSITENRKQGIHPQARIGTVCLESSRVEMLAEFYRECIGLNRLPRRNGAVVLGAGESALLRLQEVPEVRRPSAHGHASPGRAGAALGAFLLRG